MNPDDCYNCQHRRSIPGDHHSSCAKPDPTMKGNPHGVKHGWFSYPVSFDPIWKDSVCQNFLSKGAKA